MTPPIFRSNRTFSPNETEFAHFFSIPDDCKKIVFNFLKSPKDHCSLGMTCKKLNNLNQDSKVWTHFFHAYLPKDLNLHSANITKQSFRNLLLTRVNQLENFLKTLRLETLEGLVKTIENKSAFQKLQLIENAHDDIFIAICNSFTGYEFDHFNDEKSEDRTCVPRFMGYFKNDMPLPSAQALSQNLKKILRIEPFCACLYSYFKKNQANTLYQAISLSELTHIGLTVLQIHQSILSFSKNSCWAEMFRMGFNPNFRSSHTDSPFICTFLESYLQPAHNTPSLIPEIDWLKQNKMIPKKVHPVRIHSLNHFTYIHLNHFYYTYYRNPVRFIDKDGHPTLGIDGHRIVYGLDPLKDQLLEDFKALCEIPNIDLLAKNAKGQTALDIASRLGMQDAVEILQQNLKKQPPPI